MAVLSDSDRVKTANQWMRDYASPATCLKADVKSAVNAADDWVESNTSSYNTALPNTFRTNATTTQKYLVLMYVIMRRMGKLKVEGE